MCQEYASCEWETPYGRTVSFSDNHREEVAAMSYHPPSPCLQYFHNHSSPSGFISTDQSANCFLSHFFGNLL